MRTLLLLSVLFVFVATSQAQIFKPVEKKHKQTKKISLNVDSKTFTAYMSSGGAIYIKRISKKSGKAYNMYLGYPTTYKYNSKLIYTNKNEDKYWILKLGKTGWPSKTHLLKN